jgi:hypothetical protein
LGWTWKGQAHATPRWVIIIKKNLYLIRFDALRCVYSFKRRSTGVVVDKDRLRIIFTVPKKKKTYA